MNDYWRHEVIKALALGHSPEWISRAMDVELAEVKDIQALCNFEIEDVRADFEKGGCFHGNDY